MFKRSIPALLVFLLLAAAGGSSLTRQDELGQILDRIMERIKSYPELPRWKASVASVLTEMDKSWTPKKVTRVLKTIRVTEKDRSEEILRAEETVKGVVKDVTAKFVKEAEEERRREKNTDKEARENQEEKNKGGRSRSLDSDDLLPFNEKNRLQYTFTRLEDDVLGGRPVYVLQSQAKVESERLWQGRYFISQEGHDVLKVVLTLAKNPKFVKKFAAEVEFQVLPAGHFVLKKSKMQVDAGMLIKHVRMVIEEEYTDYEVI